MESFRRTQSINPTYAAAYNNLGMSRLFVANYRVSRGLDPMAVLAAAEPPLQETIRLHPRAFQPHTNLGRVAWTQARSEADVGRDPRAALERSRGHYAAALERSPLYAAGRVELAETWILEARWQREQGQAAREAKALDRGEALLKESLGIDGDASDAFRGLAKVALARSLSVPPGSPSARRWLKVARENLDRALEIQPGDPDSCSVAARFARQASRADLLRNEDPSASLSWGLARAEEGLRRNPQHAELRAARGGLLLERAKVEEAKMDGGGEAVRKALADLERAVFLNPRLAASLAEDLKRARQWSEAGR